MPPPKGKKKKSAQPLIEENGNTTEYDAADQHAALEEHFEEYEMSKSPGS